MRGILRGLLVILFTIPLIIQAQQPAFRNYSVDDGLPSSEIYHVIQDSKGYIWLATNMGVSRFDGRSFKNFDVQNGLPENTVFEIFEDEIGRLWFISFPFKLSYFQNDSIFPFKYNDKLRDLAGHGLVPLKKSFRADKENSIWFSFLNDGTIYKITSSGTLTESYTVNEGQTSIAITEINGQLMSAQSDKRFGELSILINTLNINNTVNIKNIKQYYSGGYFITEKHQDHILFAQNEVLTVVKPNGKYYSRNMGDRVLWIKSMNDGTFWIGKEYTGALKYDIKNFEYNSLPIEKYLIDRTITSILEDTEEGLWFTSQGDGVFYLPSRAFKTYTIDDGLSGSNIKNIELFNRKLFIGSEDSYYLDILENEKIKNISSYGQHKNKIRALKSFGDEFLWIGTEKYLHYYDGQSFRKIINNHPLLKDVQLKSSYVFSVKDIYPISLSQVLIGQMRSLAVIKNDIVTYDSFLDDTVSLRIEAIEKESDSSYLLGTFNGLWRFNGHSFENIGESTILEQRITDIARDAEVYIFATKGSGLIIKKAETFYQIDQNKGLSSNSVTSLLITRDELWAATNNGLNVIKLNELVKNNPHIQVFKKQHGLISNEINQVKGNREYIYIATNKGLTVFTRKHYKPLKHPPPIYINSISVNKRDTTFQQVPSLNYDQNFITISYGGINFRDAGQLLYKYRLVGLTENWVFSRNIQVEYAFLPSGTYRFEVLAINSEGLISASPAVLEFVIKPPFWKTWWFISFIITAALLLFVIYFNARIHMIRREHQWQTNINMFREQALIRQMDPHFVFNSLNSIQSFIIKNDTTSSSHYLSKFAKLMRVILNNSQKQAVTLYDEIDALSLYMELESMRFKQKFEYRVTVDPTLDKETTLIPAFLIQPFIENSIWHGIMNIDRPGCIQIDFQRENELILCTIQDNGIGINKSLEQKSEIEKKKKSLGISIVESRLKLLSDHFGIEFKITFSELLDNENKPSGTKVSFRIPILKHSTV